MKESNLIEYYGQIYRERQQLEEIRDRLASPAYARARRARRAFRFLCWSGFFCGELVFSLVYGAFIASAPNFWFQFADVSLALWFLLSAWYLLTRH